MAVSESVPTGDVRVLDNEQAPARKPYAVPVLTKRGNLARLSAGMISKT